MTNQFDTKIARLAKRYKGLSRVAAAMNDLYIYGIYESNFPHLMEILNSAKDHIKVVIKDTKEEIEMSGDGLTVRDTEATDPLIADPEAADTETPDQLRDKGIL
jgi:hypothetical protein|tara:strand:- start:286 stop:597 length:312 start_codon:yes stop_codon:yes gene_type:complete